MRLVVGLILFFTAPCAALSPQQSPTLRALRLENQRAALGQSAARAEDAAATAAAGFDGQPAKLPVTVQVLSPVEVVPVPGQGVEQAPPPAARPLPAKDPAAGPSYRFEGRRTAIPNLTIYTPVKDEDGNGSTTKPPAGRDWKQLAVKALPWVGAAATVGGLFFPPLLFLGGLLLGAWGALKLMSRD